MICSIMDFVQPYGLVHCPFGQASMMGISSGLPYTVAEELNTMFFTPTSRITFRSVSVPDILF